MTRDAIAWLWQRRSSARTAFVFRLVTMGLGMLLSLYWIRALAEALGAELYGLFISFLAVTRLWTLGEAGLGSAVALLAIPLIAQQRQEELQRFVAAGRTLFFALSGLFAGLVLLLSPWLPTWLGFQPLPGSGSLTALFLLGAVTIACGIMGSYANNLNYALGNVAWPVLPAFVALQLSSAAHVLIAKQGSPLWVQYTPYLIASFAGIWTAWLGIKWSDRSLSAVTPLLVDQPIFKRLLSAGFWIYLSSLGNLLFTTTAQLVVNAGFGPEIVPPYVLNYKIPELAYGLIAAAGLVAFSKIARLVNSSRDHEKRHGQHLFTYLHRLQIWVGMSVAVVYVFLNDQFIEWWLGTDYRVPVYLQLAFAANLVFAAAGDAPLRAIGMFSSTNLPFFGRAIFAMGAFNLGLSLVFMRMELLIGIAVAAVVAQAGLNCLLTVRLARQEGPGSRPLLIRTLVHPLLFVIVLLALRWLWPLETFLGKAALVATAAVWLTGEFWLLGLRPNQLRTEYKHMLTLLKPNANRSTWSE